MSYMSYLQHQHGIAIIHARYSKLVKIYYEQQLIVYLDGDQKPLHIVHGLILVQEVLDSISSDTAVRAEGCGISRIDVYFGIFVKQNT